MTRTPCPGIWSQNRRLGKCLQCYTFGRFPLAQTDRIVFSSPFLPIHLALPRAFVLYLFELRVYDIIILRRAGSGRRCLLGSLSRLLGGDLLVDLSANLLENSREIVARRFYPLRFLSG